jgi:hypothetical protein
LMEKAEFNFAKKKLRFTEEYELFLEFVISFGVRANDLSHLFL